MQLESVFARAEQPAETEAHGSHRPAGIDILNRSQSHGSARITVAHGINAQGTKITCLLHTLSHTPANLDRITPCFTNRCRRIKPIAPILAGGRGLQPRDPFQNR